MVRTRSAARRASVEAKEKFDKETKGKGTMVDPFILDPVGPPPGFTEADKFDPQEYEEILKMIRKNHLDPAEAKRLDPNNYEFILKMIRRNIHMQQQGSSSSVKKETEDW